MSISKIFLSITTTFALFTMIISTPFAIKTYAGAAGTRVVTSRSGLNVRDKNCNKIAMFDYGQMIAIHPDTIVCTINGTKHEMIRSEVYGNANYPDQYVAKSYTGDVIGALPQGTGAIFDTTKVNAEGGLNLRDSQCKKVRMVANNTQLEDVRIDKHMLCNRDDKFYYMIEVKYKNNTYFVAKEYVSFSLEKSSNI